MYWAKINFLRGDVCCRFGARIEGNLITLKVIFSVPAICFVLRLPLKKIV